jgi:hypothetical protein
MSGKMRKEHNAREAFIHAGLKGLARSKKYREKCPDARVREVLYH